MSNFSNEETRKVHRAIISDMMRVVLRLKLVYKFKGSEILFIMANVWRGSGDLEFENYLLEKTHEYRRYEQSGR